MFGQQTKAKPQPILDSHNAKTVGPLSFIKGSAVKSIKVTLDDGTEYEAEGKAHQLFIVVDLSQGKAPHDGFGQYINYTSRSQYPLFTNGDGKAVIAGVNVWAENPNFDEVKAEVAKGNRKSEDVGATFKL